MRREWAAEGVCSEGKRAWAENMPDWDLPAEQVWALRNCQGQQARPVQERDT